ncbi:calcium-binding protein [Calothrix sp. 336/3]|uniref:calcium-binding protein n=1 Tax=Calothrix sp. 336/3 TaxID=1337936 RepID=UPI000A69A60C|nr:calcium-binding protein [Calothrix sp. 336/3]
MGYAKWNSKRGRGIRTNGGNEDFLLIGWNDYFNLDSDFQLIDTKSKPLIFIVGDEGVKGVKGDSGNPVHDGNNTVVITLDGTNLGFEKDVYIFSEEDAKKFGGTLEQKIPLKANSNIKAVTIIIEDNDPGSIYNLKPIKGTSGADILKGTSKGDAIYGYEGDDKLYGFDGSDSIYGFSGNDSIWGGKSWDMLYGLSGNDKIYGEDGSDSIDGGEGNDYLDGGNDDDNIFGWNGNDTLIGGNGNDNLYGEGGNDILIGGTGNDTLTGGTGKDTLTGGNGADKFVFKSLSEGIDTITDFKYQEGDKIEISKVGFGATSTSEFSYNNSNGALSFKGKVFAYLQSGLGIGFIPSSDINLFDETLAV